MKQPRQTGPDPDRSRRGAVSYQSGLAAEDAVGRHYTALGLPVVARRWRGQGGEIDLICANGNGFLFVEVKSGPSFERAIDRFCARQLSRISLAAQEFVSDRAAGLDTPMRVDLALVDGTGTVSVLENVSLH